MRLYIDIKNRKLNDITNLYAVIEYNDGKRLVSDIKTWDIELWANDDKDPENKNCLTCIYNDDDYSGEYYECIKGIADHYKSKKEIQIGDEVYIITKDSAFIVTGITEECYVGFSTKTGLSVVYNMQSQPKKTGRHFDIIKDIIGSNDKIKLEE